MHDNMNITALLAGLSARNGDRPKYLALADAVEQAFREHELPPGTALPPQRALARALGVTLGTVSRAYAEAATRGLVEASVGRGTFIRVQRPDVDVMPPEAAEGGEAAPDAPHCLPTKRPAADAGNHAVLRAKPALHNLGFIAPFEHLNPSLSQGLRKLTEHDAAMLDGLQSYRRPGGMLRHREAGALWAGRYGLAARPADLLICAGSQARAADHSDLAVRARRPHRSGKPELPPAAPAGPPPPHPDCARARGRRRHVTRRAGLCVPGSAAGQPGAGGLPHAFLPQSHAYPHEPAPA